MEGQDLEALCRHNEGWMQERTGENGVGEEGCMVFFCFFFTCGIVRDGVQALWGHFSCISVLDRGGRRARAVFCFSFVFLWFSNGFLV